MTPDAFILAGGLGTRLRGVLDDLAKPLAPVGGRPFLSFLLDQLIEAGAKRCVLCTGHLADQIESVFGTEYRGLNLLYSPETKPLGTAGALRKALPLLRGQSALVLNGDSYVEADLRQFLAFTSGRDSLVAVEVDNAQRFGSLELAADGRIEQFREKQAGPSRGWINAGVYHLTRSLLESIPNEKPVSLEREIFPARITHGLYGWRSPGRFIDVGTPESLSRAEAFFHDLHEQDVPEQPERGDNG